MNKLQTFIAALPCGFITSAQMPELITLDRLHPVLIRCGGCRLTCAAQDVAHIMRCIEAGGDYVRDVSLPVGSTERAANWVEAGNGLVSHVPDPQYAAKHQQNIALNSRPAMQRAGAWSLNRGDIGHSYDDTITEPNFGL